MPNIPTYTRRDPRRVIGPALTDPSGARVASDAPARGAVAKAQGEQDLWRGVQKFGIDVTNFVNQKITENETFKDNNARIKAATRRKVTEREFELFKQTHHSSQWAEEWQRLSSDAVADQDTYEYGTSKGRQTDLGVSQGWMSIGGARAAASAASAYKTETISNQERMLAVAAAEYGQDDIRTKREIEAYRDILDEVQAGTPKGTVDIAIGRILETSQKQYEAAQDGLNKDIVTNWAQNGLPYDKDTQKQMTAEAAVNQLEKDPSKRKDLMTTFSSAESAFRAGEKVSNDKAIESELAYIDERFILPDDKFLAEAPDLLKKINESGILPVKGENGAGKEGQRKKINDRIKAIKNGDTDPIYEYDVGYYNKLSERISKNPRDVSETEINNAAGRGKVGGITAGADGQQGKLIKLKRFLQDDIANNRLYSLYSTAIGTLESSKAFNKDKTRNAELASEARILMNSWAVEETRTERDYETFYNGLVSELEMSGISDGLWWSSRKSEQAQQSKVMRDYVKGLGVDIDSDSEPAVGKYKKGDTKIINGTTWTFNGNDWKS